MKKRFNFVPLLSLLWALSILALGSWWLFLILKFSRSGFPINSPEQSRLYNMIAWEGGTFLVLLILLSGTLISYFLKDQKKTKALQAFFAGLTHELKTPLASMRLQAEVLKDVVEEERPNPDRIKTLSTRMIEDAMNLETQMDKILQLSRIEKGGTLNIASIPLNKTISRLIDKFGGGIQMTFEPTDPKVKIRADEFALELIFKNLFENTRIHSKGNKVSLSVEYNDEIILRYHDDEALFEGDFNRLSELFYKHNSARGSGIGLYLVNQLMTLMKGKFRCHLNADKGLLFELHFKKGESDDA